MTKDQLIDLVMVRVDAQNEILNYFYIKFHYSSKSKGHMKSRRRKSATCRWKSIVWRRSSRRWRIYRATPSVCVEIETRPAMNQAKFLSIFSFLFYHFDLAYWPRTVTVFFISVFLILGKIFPGQCAIINTVQKRFAFLFVSIQNFTFLSQFHCANCYCITVKIFVHTGFSLFV